MTGSLVLAGYKTLTGFKHVNGQFLYWVSLLIFFLKCEKVVVFRTRLGKDALFLPVSETVYSCYLDAFIPVFFLLFLPF